MGWAKAELSPWSQGESVFGLRIDKNVSQAGAPFGKGRGSTREGGEKKEPKSKKKKTKTKEEICKKRGAGAGMRICDGKGVSGGLDWGRYRGKKEKNYLYVYVYIMKIASQTSGQAPRAWLMR